MSSDKAPDKIVRWIGKDHSVNYSDAKYQADGITYIREDLIPSDDSYVDYLKERTAYEEQQQKKAIARAERRREMFEKVALKQLEPGHTYSSMNEYITAVIKTTNIIISESDKFARGEE